MGIYIAIDYGKKRIGMAHCDAGEQFVFGMPTVANQGGRKAIAKTIMDVLVAKKAEALVLGLPRNMDGSEGFMAETVRRFADDLWEISDEFIIHFFDERLTSKVAEAKLRDAGVAYTRNKGIVDEEAARQILEDFLRTKTV